MPLVITEGLGGSPNLGTSPMATLQGLFITPLSTSLDVTFNQQPFLTGPGLDPAEYTITSENGITVRVTAVSTGTNTIHLETDEHAGNLRYTLELPYVGVVSMYPDTLLGPYQAPLIGPYEYSYTSPGDYTAILWATPIHCRLLRIRFQDYVVEEDALIASNYTITNGITAESVTQVEPLIFDLEVSRLVASTSYAVTASNIRSRSR